ncbi:MAG TPA: class I SAM-dependent methyltransferase [Candidatus Acidoferrum sp.]
MPCYTRPMIGDAATLTRRSRSLATLPFLLCCSTLLFSADWKISYLTFADVSETLRMFADSGLPGSNISASAAWNRWIRDQDREVRARIDRGEEDSISNLILYGTSYTSLPRLESAESAGKTGGPLSEAAMARVRALVIAVHSAQPNERIRIVRDFLKRKGIAAGDASHYLTANLQRFADEQRAYQQKLVEAGHSGDMNEVLSTRGTLYQNRGLSADTSLMTNYALEDTLSSLIAKNFLASGSVRRIAVIGPGLDFTNKHNGYDFYPLQTIQPFAAMETALRLNLAKPDNIEVFTLDLNPSVNAHIARLAHEALSGRPYIVQLPRDSEDEWPSGAENYWQHFGEIIGVQAKPLPVPQTLTGVTLRAVSIAPRFASRITPLDANVVTQRVALPPARGFDLVIATNILVYYDRFQQALAMASIARMMNPGGIFLSNDALSAHHVQSLEFLDRHSVSFSTKGRFGDNVLSYRRK